MNKIRKEKPNQLMKLTKKELVILYLKTLLDSKKIVTPEIKKSLLSMGFQLKVIGVKEEDAINSTELKTNFHGYDIAIGLAAVSVSYGSKRKYSALVLNLPNDF